MFPLIAEEVGGWTNAAVTNYDYNGLTAPGTLTLAQAQGLLRKLIKKYGGQQSTGQQYRFYTKRMGAEPKLLDAPVVKESGFVIHVFTDKNLPGLTVERKAWPWPEPGILDRTAALPRKVEI